MISSRKFPIFYLPNIYTQKQLPSASQERFHSEDPQPPGPGEGRGHPQQEGGWVMSARSGLGVSWTDPPTPQFTGKTEGDRPPPRPPGVLLLSRGAQGPRQAVVRLPSQQATPDSPGGGCAPRPLPAPPGSAGPGLPSHVRSEGRAAGAELRAAPGRPSPPRHSEGGGARRRPCSGPLCPVRGQRAWPPDPAQLSRAGLHSQGIRC